METRLRTAPGGVPDGRIRGAALREFLRWYEQEYAPDDIEAAIDAIGADGMPVFQSGLPAYGVLSSRWYEATHIHELLEALSVHTLGPEAAREGGRVVMQRTLSGVFRAMMRFLVTPERYARHSGRIWAHYYDTGEFVTLPRGPGCTVTTIRHWSAHHPLLCEMNVAAAEVIYEHMGCANVRVERHGCIRMGSSACQYQVDWDV